MAIKKGPDNPVQIMGYYLIMGNTIIVFPLEAFHNLSASFYVVFILGITSPRHQHICL